MHKRDGRRSRRRRAAENSSSAESGATDGVMMVSSVVLFVFAVASAVAEKKLVFVTVLFRHGDRSPVKAYPTDPYQESSWPQGFGQLSQEGMRQHFELGQYLRSRYKNFLNESYVRHEILVRSTDYDRTLMSAEANLAGLYPPKGEQAFHPELEWQPIPVHTVPQSEERLLSFPLGDCPRYRQLMEETAHTKEFLNVTSTYQARHNKSAPAWVTPEVMDKLRILKDFGFQVSFGFYKQQEKSRLQGGVLLGEIVKNLSRMAVPDPTRQFKMMMLSAHDTTVTALQASLNVFNGKQPPYASCHFFELYRNDDGSTSVSMFYRNDSSVEPYPLQLSNCSLDCPLEDFVSITSHFISPNRDEECQLPSAELDREVIISLAVASCLLFILIVILLTVVCRQSEPFRNRGYHHVRNQEADSR
uniref:Lysosomal acid phosphatase n=1 Tax=Oryzias sinensis TaxID=183150 RepID=A0A8C7YUX7_9TELE